MSVFTAPPSMSAPAQREPLLAVARRRRVRRVLPAGLAGVLLLAVSFVGFLAAEPKPVGTPVLALAQPVVAGHTLVPADLKVVTVRAPGVPVLPVSEQGQVVGRAAAVSLPAGSLLAPGDLAGAAGPQPGQAIVGAALKPGSYPAGISPGAVVLVFGGPGSPLTQASVYALANSPDGSSVEVSLLVPASAAAAVNAAATAGSVSLVWVSP